MSEREREIIAEPGVIERAVALRSGGRTLRGVIARPEGGAPCRRAVVFLHGWGTYRSGPHSMIVKAAREFASRLGMPSLRFDLTGRGESDGEFAEAGLDEMIEDASASASFVGAELGCGSTLDVYALGVCSGGNVAVAAAALDGVFGGVASLSMLPYQSHKNAMQSLRRTRGLLGKVAAKALDPANWKRLLTGRASVFRVIATLFGGEGGRVKSAGGQTRNLKDSRRDAMKALESYEGRLLFVYGGADAEGAGARAHFEEFAIKHGLHARFEVIDGASHNFYSLEWERQVIDRAAGFVADSAAEGRIRRI